MASGRHSLAAATLVAACCLLAASAQQSNANAAKPATNPNAAALTIQFDNRGSKVMGEDVNKQILQALADKVFLVPVSQVSLVGGLGQSSLLNHQAVVTYRAVGPTTNGKRPLENCQTNTKEGWFSNSPLYNAIKKATDTWWPNDAVKVQSATCSSSA